MLTRPRDRYPRPQRYLSSSKVGWEGLEAQAFDEPAELENWTSPAPAGISLIVFSGGPMRLERRWANDEWRAVRLSHGDLILRSASGPSYNLRWHGLSAAPTRTLHVALSPEVMAEAPSIVDRFGLRDPLLSNIGLALWRELELGTRGSSRYVRVSAQMLLAHLVRHYTVGPAAVEPPSTGLTHDQVGQLTEFVQEHLHEHLSLARLGRYLGLSPAHFTRLFRRSMGESPHQYVIRKRIERARFLIEQGDLPLAHVALEVGFANQSHFSETFRRQVGVTPLRYRRDRISGAGF